MRQPAIPKLSKLSTAGRAELLAVWTAMMGKPPSFRASRELLASALAWQLQERKFGGLTAATKVQRNRLAENLKSHRGGLPALENGLDYVGSQKAHAHRTHHIARVDPGFAGQLGYAAHFATEQLAAPLIAANHPLDQGRIQSSRESAGFLTNCDLHTAGSPDEITRDLDRLGFRA